MIKTNKTHSFFRLPDIVLFRDSPSISMMIERDSIITVSTRKSSRPERLGLRNEGETEGHRKGQAEEEEEREEDGQILRPGNESEVVEHRMKEDGYHRHDLSLVSFPLPYVDSFDDRPLSHVARYFADNGGSFEIATDPSNSSNQVVQNAIKVFFFFFSSSLLPLSLFLSFSLFLFSFPFLSFCLSVYLSSFDCIPFFFVFFSSF